MSNMIDEEISILINKETYSNNNFDNLNNNKNDKDNDSNNDQVNVVLESPRKSYATDYYKQPSALDSFDAQEELKKKLHELNDISFKENNNIDENKDYFISDSKSDIPILDQMHTYTGYGKLQIKQFFCAGFIFFSEGFFLTLIPSCIIPIKEYFSIKDFQICVINILIFFSLALGNILIPQLTQRFTRRQIYIVAFLLKVPCCIILMSTRMVEVWAASYILIGLSLGLVVPLSMNIMAEFMPIKYRAFTITFVWIFFTLAQLMTPILLSIFMPNLEAGQMGNIFMVGSTITCLLMFISIIIYTETPRHLLFMHRNDEAFDILEIMINKQISNEDKLRLINENNYSKKEERQENYNDSDNNAIDVKSNIEHISHNNNKKDNDINNKLDINYETISASNIHNTSNQLNREDNYNDIIMKLSNNNNNNNINKEIQQQKDSYDCLSKSNNESTLDKLFAPKYFKISVISTILWSINAMIFYGPSLILTVTIDQISQYYNESLGTDNQQSLVNSKNEIVKSLFLYAIAAGFSLTLSACLTEIKFFGRRGSMIWAYFSGFIAGSFMLVFPDHFIYFFLLMSFFTTIGYNIMCSFTTELYSSDIRDTAMGFFFFMNRLCSVISQFVFLQLFHINFFIPYSILILLSLGGSICALMFPYDTYGKSLDIIK